MLSGAWTAIVGQAPSRDTAQLLTAHWALETDGGRAMPGHNFAGIKASPTAKGAFFDTIEGHGAARRELSARFRVYDSPEAGARDYVKLLETRYPAALEAARSGDTADFARALAAGGYFTADPAAYSAGLRQRRENLAESAPSASNGAPPPTPVFVAELALGGLLHAFRSGSEDA
ncbi:MAG: glucosaminidase domain-containing protein [Polyangiaceae bacterium]